jgi:hypothetical protein
MAQLQWHTGALARDDKASPISALLHDRTD